MFIAKIRIKTADGFILPGEPVKGLGKDDIKELKAGGYIVSDAAEKPEAKPKPRRRVQPAKPAAAAPVDETEDDEEGEEEDTGTGGDGAGGGENLPPGINSDLL